MKKVEQKNQNQPQRKRRIKNRKEPQRKKFWEQISP